MIRQRINNLRQRESGFTIVELLIVIVVIGILAAITIIAYNGITAKANGANSRSNAETVQKISEAFNADRGSYPSSVTLLVAYGSVAGDSSTVPTALSTGVTATYSSTTVPTTGGIADGTSTTLCAGATSLTQSCLNASNGTKYIVYVPTTAVGAGACIGYYSYAATSPGTLWVYAGTASTPAYASSKYTCT